MNLTPDQEPPDSEEMRKTERKLQWRLRDNSDAEVQEMYEQLLADPKPEAALAARVYKRVLERRMGQGRGRRGRAGQGGREQPKSVAADLRLPQQQWVQGWGREQPKSVAADVRLQQQQWVQGWGREQPKSVAADLRFQQQQWVQGWVHRRLE